MIWRFGSLRWVRLAGGRIVSAASLKLRYLRAGSRAMTSDCPCLNSISKRLSRDSPAHWVL